jgi:hypothetical protein
LKASGGGESASSGHAGHGAQLGAAAEDRGHCVN